MMSDIARLYIYIITGLIIGCMSIGLCSAVYYIVNDKELLFKIISESKIIGLGIGLGWLISKFFGGSGMRKVTQEELDKMLRYIDAFNYIKENCPELVAEKFQDVLNIEEERDLLTEKYQQEHARLGRLAYQKSKGEMI